MKEYGLNAAQLLQFEADGFISPVLLASPEKRDFLQQAYAEFRHQLQASSEPEHGWSDLRFRSHLYLPWLSDLLLESDLGGRLIVSARQVLKSDDLVIWSSDWCVKEPPKDRKQAERQGFFSWHQDSTYSGFDGSQAVTFWIAFCDLLDPACGPVRFRAGSHKLGQLHHTKNVGEAGNMLAFGQCIEAEAWASQVEHLGEKIAFPLRVGEASIHDFSVVHASDENLARDARIGLAVRVVRADAFAQIDKFAKRSAAGLPERVTPLSCANHARLPCDFETLRAHYADVDKWCFEVEPRPSATPRPVGSTGVSSPNSDFGCLNEWRISMARENSAYFGEAGTAK